MIYAKVDVNTREVLEYPVDPAKIREWSREANVSIPIDFSSVDLTTWGWYQVDYIQPPPLTTPGHTVVLDTPTWDGERLIRTFKEVPRPESETKRLWGEVRKRRNKLLADSDWVELPSVVNQKTPEWLQMWKDYRIKLRDVTLAPDPEMVEWPNVPENTNEQP